MGLLSNQISRDKLKPGDHIYSWRTAYFYSHHGIYVGDGKVIHFTRGSGPEIVTGTYLEKIVVSSVPKTRGDNPCPVCGDQSNLDGVISSCIDCFLTGGNLYLFEYGVSSAFLMAKPRGGTCTVAPSDPSDEVVYRAKFLLSRNGLVYDLLTNNCENFAVYCKTSLIVLSSMLGSCGQANSVTAATASSVLSWSARGLVKRVSLNSATKYVVSGFSGLGAMAVVAYCNYCIGRLNSDIGVRKDVSKVPVEGLVAFISTLKSRVDENKNVS